MNYIGFYKIDTHIFWVGREAREAQLYVMNTSCDGFTCLEWWYYLMGAA